MTLPIVERLRGFAVPWRAHNWAAEADAIEEAADTIEELYRALDEYTKCVAIATDPAMQQADVITLVEVQDRMIAAREAAVATLAKLGATP